MLFIMENNKKRERSTNFNKSEVRLLTELVAKHRTIIENKKSDAVTNKDKEVAWSKIASLFNAATGFTSRSTKTLKLKYESIKKETKKTMAKHRQELYRTGGGPSSGSDFTDIEEKVMAICSNITGLDARNDSDSIPAPKPKEAIKVILEDFSLPLQTTEIMPCDDIPITSDQYEFCPDQDKLKPNTEVEDTENDQDALSAYQDNMNNMKIIQNEQENNWSSWNPTALKTKISPGLQPPTNHKVTKAGVTARLDQLSKARLELVELQKEIARKEHEFVDEEHKLKMLHLQNDEERKQELHVILVRQLSNRVHSQNDIMDNLIK